MSRSMSRIALLLGLFAAIGSFAIDMYLPALPQVAEDLDISEGAAASTLTIYFVTFGVAQLLWGPMSDAIGRRLPLAIGTGIFLGASIAAALAPDLGWLLAARALQGFGAATLMAVPRAVIRDLSSGPDATRMMASIMMVISVSPMLAPLAGSAVLAVADWRAIFGLLALGSTLSLALVLLVLPETLDPSRRQPVDVANMLSGARRLVLDPRFMGLTMIGGFGMASFFVFLASASFVYTGQFGLTETGFSLAFAANAAGFFLASQFAAPLGARFGMERVMAAAVTGFFAATAALFFLVWIGGGGLWVVIAGLIIANAFLGLVLPTSMVVAVDPHPDMAGLAASLGGTVQMLVGAAMIGVCAPFFDGTATPMVAAIASCAALAFVAAALTLRRPGRSRTMPAGMARGHAEEAAE